MTTGAPLRASPGHPLADGRLAGEIRVGDGVDGASVIALRRIPYGGGATFDLQPSGTTRIYWANGIPVVSTLAPPAD